MRSSFSLSACVAATFLSISALSPVLAAQSNPGPMKPGMMMEKAPVMNTQGSGKMMSPGQGKGMMMGSGQGKGMMMGVELSIPAKEIVGRLLAGGIITGTAGEKVLRFLPPLVITRDDVDTVVAALRDAMKELPNG